MTNMSVPYNEGKIEGGHFALQWVCHMLEVNIRIWSTQTRRFEYKFSCGRDEAPILDLLQDISCFPHVQYEPLLQQGTTLSNMLPHIAQYIPTSIDDTCILSSSQSSVRKEEEVNNFSA